MGVKKIMTNQLQAKEAKKVLSLTLAKTPKGRIAAEIAKYSKR